MSKPSTVTYSDEISDKLLKLMNDTGYSIVQVNGQRIFYSPKQEKIPPRGCEVFVGKIPRDCYEDELCPLFMSAGRVFQLRLMMMFSGTNRGYAFVMYERQEDAERAVYTLDNYEIRRGHRIGVLPCVNNCRLFLGFFGFGERSDQELEAALRSETEGVVSVSRRLPAPAPISGRRGEPRWYLLVEYCSHRAAAIARRELTPRRHQLFGPRVIVDWEVPLHRRGRKMAQEQRRTIKQLSPVFKMTQPSSMHSNEASKQQYGSKDQWSLPMDSVHKNAPYSQWREAEKVQHRGSMPRNPVVSSNPLTRSLDSYSAWNSTAPLNNRPHTSPNVGFLPPNSLKDKNYLQDLSDMCDNLGGIRGPRPLRPVLTSLSCHDSGIMSDVEPYRPTSSDSSSGSGLSISVGERDMNNNYNQMKQMNFCGGVQRNNSEPHSEWQTEPWIRPMQRYSTADSSCSNLYDRVWKSGHPIEDDYELMMNLFEQSSDFRRGLGSMPSQSSDNMKKTPALEDLRKVWSPSSIGAERNAQSCSILSHSASKMQKPFNPLPC